MEGPHVYPTSMAARARCQHPTTISRNNTCESNFKTCLVPLTVKTVICQTTLTENVRFANQAIQQAPASSLRHTSTISGPSQSLLRTADMMVWQPEHAPYADVVFVCPCFWLGQFGKATSGKHVLAVSIDWHLKDLRGVSA